MDTLTQILVGFIVFGAGLKVYDIGKTAVRKLPVPFADDAGVFIGLAAMAFFLYLCRDIVL